MSPRLLTRPLPLGIASADFPFLNGRRSILAERRRTPETRGWCHPCRRASAPRQIAIPVGSRRRRCRWRSPTRLRDGAGPLGKPPRFGRLTRSESGFSVYGMEMPPPRDPQRRKPSGALAQGLAHALKVRKPAYPGYNPGAGEGLRPFEPEQPRAPVDCAGGGVAPPPPVTARPDG